MQDDHLIDLAELDLFREREDGTGSYNEFRYSLGEPPVSSFLELTGGNAELAREIERVYQGDIDKVDAGIGILAEPKPAGFALGFVQFYQFVLNAPRRVKSSRFLSEGYTYDEYKQGMNWVEHGGGFKGAIRRHLPGLDDKLEGVKRGFAPWPDAENFPERLLSDAEGDIGSAFFTDLRTLVLGTIASAAGVRYGLLSSRLIIMLLEMFFVVTVYMAIVRLLARRILETCEKKCNTDNRRSMFGSLYQAEKTIRGAALTGHFWALTAILLAGTCAWISWPAHPGIALLYVLTAASAISTSTWSKTFTRDLHVLKIALRNRMRKGEQLTDTDSSLGAVEEKELRRLFVTYAPGRQYLTAYDFSRMRETEGPRTLGANLGLGSNKMLIDYGDLVVEEDRKLTAAVSMNTCRRVLKGLAQNDLKREMAEGDDNRGFKVSG